jgi:hypothetical protein
LSDQAEARVATSPAFTADLADDVARTALAMAQRFAASATLWCVAPDWPQHAEHVAVEFVHPVIMGKRALPAVAILERDAVAALRSQVRTGDLVLAVSGSDSPPVRATLRRAPAWGTPTVWIGAGARPEPGLADHVLWLDEDPGVAAHTGRMVLLYHLLWELTHVCFEHPGLLGGDGDAGEEARCATCSDEAHLVEVVAGNGPEAVAARGACGVEEVSTAVVEEVRPGDLLLVHAGTAINVVEHEADRR